MLIPPGNSDQGPQAYEALKQAGLNVRHHWICRRSVPERTPIARATVNQLKGTAAKTAWFAVKGWLKSEEIGDLVCRPSQLTPERSGFDDDGIPAFQDQRHRRLAESKPG